MGSYGAFKEEAKRLAGILRNDPVLWAQYLQKPIKGAIMQKFEMGVQVEDLITGLKGTVTGYVKYITGCNQYLISPRRGDSGNKAEWIDESRLKQTKGKKVVINTPFGINGPDLEAPIR